MKKSSFIVSFQSLDSFVYLLFAHLFSQSKLEATLFALFAFSSIGLRYRNSIGSVSYWFLSFWRIECVDNVLWFPKVHLQFFVWMLSHYTDQRWSIFTPMEPALGLSYEFLMWRYTAPLISDLPPPSTAIEIFANFQYLQLFYEVVFRI